MKSRNKNTLASTMLAWLLANAPLSSHAAAPVYLITPESPDVIGELGQTTSVYKDTISDLARDFDQGYREMRLANPKVDSWLPGDGTPVLVPSMYIIPDAPRDGITINIAEMRMYYFNGKDASGAKRLMTFPISIGREQWVTPKGRTTVVGKVKDPAWHPPKSIRKEHAEEGDILPAVVPPGPDNPLGTHALMLGIEGYLIHGTDKPFGIGMRVTHGCIRMYPEDIVTMFKATPVGTPVHIVNQPLKVGISNGNIYLEVHPHLEEEQEKAADEQYSKAVKLILARVKGQDASLVWADIKHALESPTGVPQVVGTVQAKLRNQASNGESVRHVAGN
ncbi:MAG: L,D-transpeptidase family protein [Gammaproteobacteria bacterium]|nr:L,D-transpeptidase family protein [Gammaproteobacteria bacterium]